jgi:hypothetical protein
MRNLQITSESLFNQLKQNVESLIVQDFNDEKRTFSINKNSDFYEFDYDDNNDENYLSYLSYDSNKRKESEICIEFFTTYLKVTFKTFKCEQRYDNRCEYIETSSILSLFNKIDTFIIEQTISCLLIDLFVQNEFSFYEFDNNFVYENEIK